MKLKKFKPIYKPFSAACAQGWCHNCTDTKCTCMCHSEDRRAKGRKG